MRIKFKKHKWKILLYSICFIFGICIILSIANSSRSLPEYKTVEGEYVSYRVKRIGWRHHRNVLITIQTADNNLCEYRISSISLISFNEKDFAKNVSDGDFIKLTLDGNSIVAIESQGETYLSLENSTKQKKSNSNTGYFVGAFSVIVSTVGFSTLIEKKRKGRSRR